MGYFYIFCTILFTVVGQLMLKWRIIKYGELPDGISDKLLFLFKLLFDPYIFSGFLSAFFASLFWMAAMTRFDLSEAYPIIIGGLALFTTFAAFLFLKEDLTFVKLSGIFLIIFGIYIVSK